MAGGSSKSNPTRLRKRVEVADGGSTLKRARDGSAFIKCEACSKDVPVVLIDMHDCGLDSKIRMNLEAQVVEKEAEAKKPAAKKRAAPSSEKKEKKVKKEKKEKKPKNPNMPKRPPTAFFVFMDEFRKTFKEANPDNKSVALVAKEGGEKWKSLTDEEKKPYIDRAAELKVEYEKAKEEQQNAEEENEGSSKEEEAAEEENAEGEADNKEDPTEDDDEC